DISLAGIFLFGLLPAADPRMMATMRAIEERLAVKTAVGGIARYENDSYFQISNDITSVQGNTWFVSTLWLAEHYIAVAEKLEDLARAKALVAECESKGEFSGVILAHGCTYPYDGQS